MVVAGIERRSERSGMIRDYEGSWGLRSMGIGAGLCGLKRVRCEDNELSPQQTAGYRVGSALPSR